MTGKGGLRMMNKRMNTTTAASGMLSRAIIFVVWAVLFLFVCAYAATDILFVNNSLTYVHNVPAMIESLGVNETTPVSLDCDMHSIAGGELRDHLVEECFSLISSGEYEYVVLQGYTNPIYDRGAFFSAARQLNDSIATAGATTIFFMTWAPRNERDFFDFLATSYDSIGNELNAAVAPVGRVWELLMEDIPTDQFYSDFVHATCVGSYVAACVLYATLTNTSPVGNPYAPVDTPYVGPSYCWGCDSTAEALQRVSWDITEGYNDIHTYADVPPTRVIHETMDGFGHPSMLFDITGRCINTIHPMSPRRMQGVLIRKTREGAHRVLKTETR